MERRFGPLNTRHGTEVLIANERIRKVEFIGSAAVGRIIGSVAAKHLKPILMELGGKCPAIVLDDADLQKAAGLCAAGGRTVLAGMIRSSNWLTDIVRSTHASRSDLFFD